MEETSTAPAPLETVSLAASEPFVGRWNRLVSTTNWEKGRIICQWREALEADGSPVTAYSDETWARLVGGVTGQHIGRLRRVYQRFGSTYEQYRGLFWSHFFAASDWNDGEMWLEGAVQSHWSVSQMRNQRWETLGKVAADKPREEDEITSEKDEDLEASTTRESIAPQIEGSYDAVQGPRHDGPDFGDEDAAGGTARQSFSDDEEAAAASRNPVELIQPFADLPDLPADLGDAVDLLKLALLHHKTAGWNEISQQDAVKVIEALRAMILAPSDQDDAAPF